MDLANALLAVLALAMSVASPGPTPTPTDPVQSAYQAMSPAQRVGQLFMVGVATTGPTTAQLQQLHQLAVGSVILDGNSSAGRSAVSATTASIKASLTTSGIAPFIATDQEGGEVQRLTGPGFSTIPTALEQGRIAPTDLQGDAGRWGRQLSVAGVSLNLAPVADVVPARNAHANQPIGRYDREYGHTATTVAPHVVAVVRGESAHVAVTLKHFPGLGRATGNTDETRGVTDPTTPDDRYLTPFRQGIAAGAPFVMVSLATYPNIDPAHSACFSTTVMRTLLRHNLGFGGVVISDDFHAVAVRNVPPAKAALRFFRAGGTLLLDTDVTPIQQMEQAVLAQARDYPAFAAVIKADVLEVLQAKNAEGLLS